MKEINGLALCIRYSLMKDFEVLFGISKQEIKKACVRMARMVSVLDIRH